MTFKQYYIKYLMDRGFFENDAESVFNAFSKAPENEVMAQRWDESVSGYPEIMRHTGLLSLCDHAMDYIDSNIPKAWFRPFFARATQKQTAPADEAA